MDFDVEHFVRNLIIVLVSVTLCTATSESVMARFTENKNVATSHTTLQNVSDIQCVRKCNKERQRGMCTLAEYNKATKACYLSVDEPHAALDTADEMTGVFVLEPVPQRTTVSPQSTTLPSTTTQPQNSSPLQTTTLSQTTTEPQTSTLLETTSALQTTATPPTTTAPQITTVPQTTTTSAGLTCDEPLLNGTNPVPDSYFTASSANTHYYAHSARLNSGDYGWVATSAEINTIPPTFFLQVRFNVLHTVTQVATKGAVFWVTLYRLAYSEDCVTFHNLLDGAGNDAMFPANTNPNILVNQLPSPITALCIRLHPLEWNQFPELQIEVYGCPLV